VPQRGRKRASVFIFGSSLHSRKPWLLSLRFQVKSARTGEGNSEFEWNFILFSSLRLISAESGM